jgi:putative flippase GtrA
MSILHAMRLAFLVPCFVRANFRRLVRYGSVSAVSSITSLTILGVLVGIVGFPAAWSNVVATALGTVPSFELNRRWVWRDGPKLPTLRQVIPFCALAFAGLVLSTLAVRFAGGLTRTAGRSVHTLAVEVASVGTYGCLWLVQFVLCDRLLFRSHARPDGTDAAHDAECAARAADRERAAELEEASARNEPAVVAGS